MHPSHRSLHRGHRGPARGRFVWSLSLLLGVLALQLWAAPTQAAPLSGASSNMDRVCTLAGATVADKTSAANDATANDVTVGDNLANTGVDEVYYGMNAVFSTLTINVGTTGTLGAVSWSYRGPSGWSALTVTDLTVGYLTSGSSTVTWTIPSDWTAYEVSGTDCTGSRYYVRAATSVNYITLPLVTQASATPFNLKVKVQDELGTAITGLSSSAFGVSGGTTNTLFATRETGSGTYELALDTAGADVNFLVTATKDGHVTSAGLATGSLTTSRTDLTASPISINFAYKVTGVSNELSTALSGVTVSAGNLFGTSCTESGGAWYCAVPLADTALVVRAAKDGYVTNEGTSFASDRTAAGDAQRTIAVTGVQFAAKVTGVTNEISGSLSGVTVTTGDAFGVSCTESSGAWYCAVPLAHTGTDVRAAKDGYVTKTAVAAYVDRILASDAQRTPSVTGVQFAYKVTGVTAEASTSLSSVTVHAGNAQGTACSESGGAWYCAVPLADTTLTIQAAKDGYVTNTGTSFASDRTSATDAQGTAAVTGVLFTVKLTVGSEASLTGVTWEKKVGAGSYASVSPTTTSGLVAYFAQTPSEASVVFRATKGTSVGDSGAAFTASASSQTARTLNLIGSLSGLATSAVSTTVSASTTYTFGFTLVHAWPADGRLVVTLPSGYAAASPTATLTGATGTATASVSGLTVTVVRSNDGASTAISTAVTVALTGITNPSATGATGTFSLSVQNAGATVLDTGDAPAVTVGGLTISGLAASTHTVSAWTTATSLSVTWGAPTDSTVSGYSWAIDAEPDNVVDGTSRAATATGLADGSHNFRVKARNAAGTWGPVATLGDFLIDTVAPVAPSVSSSTHANNACVASSSVSFSWSSSDARSGLHGTQPYGYAVDGGSLTRTASSGLTLTLGDGSHTVVASSYDQAGNSASTSFALRVDLAAPTVTLTAPAATNAATIALTWSAADACAGASSVAIEQRLNAGAWTALSTSGTSGSLSVPAVEGTVEFRARGVDAAGNTGTFPTTPQAKTVVDRAAPGAPSDVKAAPGARGTVRVTWAAAVDDRAGVDAYRVHRVGLVGSILASATVTGLEYVDAAQPDGTQARYRVEAVDRAGNAGPSAESGVVTADASGPTVAPAGFLLQPAAPGSAPELRWLGVSGASSYAVYGVSGGPVKTEAEHLLGTTTGLRFLLQGLSQGRFAFAVAARDEAGNDGPAASLNFIHDTKPPVVRLVVPSESSIAIPIAWQATDDGAGFAQIELFVAEDGGPLGRFHSSSAADGRASYFGRAGHEYRFVAVATDNAGFMPQITQAPESRVRVVEAVARASLEAQAIAAGEPASEPFYAEDRDGDGFPETVIDPNGRVTALHVVPIERGRPVYLLGVGASTGVGNPTALWDPASGETLPVKVVLPLGEAQASAAASGPAMRVQVDKHAGWIYVPVPDAHPDRPLAAVYRSDGTALPEGTYWRAGNAVVFLDDPTTEYTVAYGRAPGPNYALVLLFALLGLMGGGLLWVLVPGTARDDPRPSAALGWSLRHCGRCGRGLARGARLLRFLHECPGLATRLRNEPLQDSAPTLSRKVALARSAARAGPPLSERLAPRAPPRIPPRNPS